MNSYKQELLNSINYYLEDNQIIQSLLQEEELELNETNIEQYQIILEQNNKAIEDLKERLVIL
ncbi:MAG: hypothetical protein II567_06250 [Candidatus Riflebacteria bacterium]|jgi:hypothetical protein|nr:hypothetical protein [Candidatus Riflebacteria bacterium]